MQTMNNNRPQIGQDFLKSFVVGPHVVSFDLIIQNLEGLQSTNLIIFIPKAMRLDNSLCEWVEFPLKIVEGPIVNFWKKVNCIVDLK